LKLQCNDLDAQWEKRSKTRSAETQAVAEAISILTTDENRELMAKSVSLLQIGAVSGATEARRRARAASVLRAAAVRPDLQANDLLAAWRGRNTPSVGSGPAVALSTLALSAQLDSFTKVKEMMDQMLADLKQQQSEEVDFKAFCTTELDTNEKDLYTKEEHKKDLENRIDSLNAHIAQLDKDIAAATEQISATQVEIKKASQTREAENKEFQAIVSDQRATQNILTKALQRLQDFYKKGIGKAVLAQQTPPVQFNAYKTNAGASPVIGLIEQIIEDSVKLEKETTASEFQAQAEYETFVKNSNALISTLQEAITTNTKAIASAKGDIAQADADLTSTVGELESLTAYKADLHNQCDFVLKNFDIRQKARMQEMEAIQAAKSILSGMKA
jgi:outer membrane murein-binding lipoprotein Lpp